MWAGYGGKRRCTSRVYANEYRLPKSIDATFQDCGECMCARNDEDADEGR